MSQLMKITFIAEKKRNQVTKQVINSSFNFLTKYLIGMKIRTSYFMRHHTTDYPTIK